MDSQENIFSADIKLLESQIEEKLDLIQQENELEKLQEYKKEIASIITKKAQIAGELSPAGSYIKQLIEERATYLNQIANSSEEVYAPTSGIVSYRIDGLEKVLLPGDFSYLNMEFLENLNLKTGQIVASSNEMGKIINNFNCYIVVNLNSESAKAAEVGKSVTIRLSTLDEVDAKIVYIADEKDDSKLIVFEINSCVEKLTSYRKISVDVIWWQDTGLRVPNEAISYENDVAYVTRTKGGYLDKIWVKILRTNGDYAIVENYTTKELQELGIEETSSKKNIGIYDEILVK